MFIVLGFCRKWGIGSLSLLGLVPEWESFLNFCNGFVAFLSLYRDFPSSHILMLLCVNVFMFVGISKVETRSRIHVNKLLVGGIRIDSCKTCNNFTLQVFS